VQNDGQCLDLMFMTDVPEKGVSGSDAVQLYGLNMNDLNNVPFTDGVYIKKLFDRRHIRAREGNRLLSSTHGKIWTGSIYRGSLQVHCGKTGNPVRPRRRPNPGGQKVGKARTGGLASGLLHKAQWGYTLALEHAFVEQSYGFSYG